MRVNIKNLLHFLLILHLNQHIIAHTAICEYKSSEISYHITSLEDYTCELVFEDTYDPQTITNLEGDHEDDKDDENVKIFKTSSSAEITKFSSVFCDKFSNLEGIVIEDVQIEELDDDSLQQCTQLKLIKLSNNKIREIPRDFLSENTVLIELEISLNEITTLNEHTFDMQEDLKKLDLSNNQITSLPSFIFDSLVNLEKLNLNGNQIMNLDPRSFFYLRKLNKLSLNSNKISNLPKNVFINLNLLMLLELNSNNLKTIHSDSFGNRRKLTTVYLNSNKIRSIDKRFIAESSIITLEMSRSICFNDVINRRNMIFPLLKKCFDDYKIRDIEIMTTSTTTTTPATTTSTTIIPTITTTTTTTTIPKSTTTSTTKTSRITPTTTEHTISSTISFKDTKFTSETVPTNPIDINKCGSSNVEITTIRKVNRYQRGDFPWSAVLLRENDDFLCNGVLVTSERVVTSARCTYKRVGNIIKQLIKREMIVLLGIHNISSTESGTLTEAVIGILRHEEFVWDSRISDADIAVIIMEHKISSRNFIRPICLSDENIDNLSDGIFFGYGKTSQKSAKYFTTPIGFTSKINERERCVHRNKAFIQVSSNRTICGGDGNYEGSCLGGAGSGLYVKYEGSFFLRGIASFELYDSTKKCNENTFTIFTDITKFVDWIRTVEEKQDDYDMYRMLHFRNNYQTESGFSRHSLTDKHIFTD